MVIHRLCLLLLVLSNGCILQLLFLRMISLLTRTFANSCIFLSVFNEIYFRIAFVKHYIITNYSPGAFSRCCNFVLFHSRCNFHAKNII